MHEIAIADRVFREAVKAGATKFFRVEVGELCEITKEELQEGLAKVSTPIIIDKINSVGSVLFQKSGEIVESGDWKYEVDFIESEISCECGLVGRARIIDRGHGYCVWDCPMCGLSGKNVEVVRGGEIKVVEVE